MLNPQAQVANADVYTDFKGLNALKAQARTDKKGALNQVAKQFEALLLSQMMKSMRQANEVFAKGNYLQSHQSKLYRGMYDHQLALDISKHQGIGLAKVLERQLGKQINAEQPSQSDGPALHASIRDYARSLPPISPALPSHLGRVSKLMQAGGTGSPGAQPGDDTAGAEQARGFASPTDFVQRLSPIARKVGQQTGIDPKLLLAQAALETGWGQHLIGAGQGQNSHNLFGIKADDGWQGNQVSVTTTEYRQGRPMKEVAPFRAYSSYADSFRDYASFLNSNPRYQSVLRKADNPTAFAQALQNSGYATDPDYGKKIQDIMQRSPIESALDVQRLGFNPGDGGE